MTKPGTLRRMSALAVILLAFAVLVAWLVGHWLGRLVAFPLIAFAFAGTMRALLDLQQDSAGAYLSIALCCVAAWYVSGVPARRRLRSRQRVGVAAWRGRQVFAGQVIDPPRIH